MQREVAEVVGCHLQLQPVGRLPVRRAHDAGVVHEDVEAGVAAQHGLGRPPDRDEVRQVEEQQLERGALELALELVARPARPSPRCGRP